MKNIINAVNAIVSRIKSALDRASVNTYIAYRDAKLKLAESEGQFVMDHAVVFVIIIVLGGVALLLLRNYLQDDLSETLKDKINDFFN